MALADKLRQAVAYKAAQNNLAEQREALLKHLEKFFTQHADWSEILYFGKSGDKKNYGMNISDCQQFLKGENFRVSWNSNSWEVQYLKISL